MPKALIIEDTPDNMKLICFILNKNGVETIGAENGRKGIELAASELPDFIILDIQLPDINGTEVLQAIRRSKADGKVPVIAMTSYAMSGDREKLLAAGCNGYIEKPVNPMTVMEQIMQILKERRHGSEKGTGLQ